MTQFWFEEVSFKQTAWRTVGYACWTMLTMLEIESLLMVKPTLERSVLQPFVMFVTTVLKVSLEHTPSEHSPESQLSIGVMMEALLPPVTRDSNADASRQSESGEATTFVSACWHDEDNLGQIHSFSAFLVLSVNDFDPRSLLASDVACASDESSNNSVRAHYGLKYRFLW